MARARETTPPEPEKTSVPIQVPLPVELHRKLKIRAATDDMPMREAVILAIEEYVEYTP